MHMGFLSVDQKGGGGSQAVDRRERQNHTEGGRGNPLHCESYYPGENCARVVKTPNFFYKGLDG